MDAVMSIGNDKLNCRFKSSCFRKKLELGCPCSGLGCQSILTACSIPMQHLQLQGRMPVARFSSACMMGILPGERKLVEVCGLYVYASSSCLMMPFLLATCHSLCQRHVHVHVRIFVLLRLSGCTSSRQTASLYAPIKKRVCVVDLPAVD